MRDETRIETASHPGPAIRWRCPGPSWRVHVGCALADAYGFDAVNGRNPIPSESAAHRMNQAFFPAANAADRAKLTRSL